MSDAVLAVRPSSLGDVVWALSIVEDIARARPGRPVDWVAEEAFASLPAMCEGVRRVVPVALRRWRHAPLAAASWREVAAFRRALRRETYGVILALQEQVKGALMARLARGVRHGFDRASVREPAAAWLDDVHHAIPLDLHFAARCRALAGAALGYAPAGPPRWRWRVPPPPAGLPARPYVVALHASSRADKRWPDAHWRALVASLGDAGLDVLLPHGSPAEEAQARNLAAGSANANVLPRLPLDAMAAVLRGAHAAVGVDTGLTHLAAAVGTPTVALFTATDASRAGVAIAGDHARDLGGRGDIPPVDAVRAALGELARLAPRC